MLMSIVVPCFNEEESIPLWERQEVCVNKESLL